MYIESLGAESSDAYNSFASICWFLFASDRTESLTGASLVVIRVPPCKSKEYSAL